MDKSRLSTSQDVIHIGEAYDTELQYMPMEVIRSLENELTTGYVSSAWEIWSTPAEIALCNAHCLASGPLHPGWYLSKKEGDC